MLRSAARLAHDVDDVVERLEELDREVERSRKALEQVPEGKYDWKPH